MDYQLVVVRHGESEWNRQNRFTGWVDVDLSPKGMEEADQAALLLRDKGYEFDLAYTSLQKRAIKTLWRVLDALELHWIEVIRHWRLNERHYGALQGLNKAETLAKHGEEQVTIWRRSYDVPPPLLDESNEYHPGLDPRYAMLDGTDRPLGESLKDVVARVGPYWRGVIWPQVNTGRKVLISAHGNSLRALAMMLTGMSKEEVVGFNIPTAEPMRFDLDRNGKALRMEFINDLDTIKAKQDAVANQAGRKQ